MMLHKDGQTGERGTHQVDDLRAGLAVLLGRLAGAEVLGIAHQQHLLRVIHRQAHLHGRTTVRMRKGLPQIPFS